jgi:hypothetical protein
LAGSYEAATGKEVASWLVDTAKGTVQPGDVKAKRL